MITELTSAEETEKPCGTYPEYILNTPRIQLNTHKQPNKRRISQSESLLLKREDYLLRRYIYIYLLLCLQFKILFSDTRGAEYTRYHRILAGGRGLDLQRRTFLPSRSTTTSRRMLRRLLITAGGTLLPASDPPQLTSGPRRWAGSGEWRLVVNWRLSPAQVTRGRDPRPGAASPWLSRTEHLSAWRRGPRLVTR